MKSNKKSRRATSLEGGPTFPLAKCIADELGDVPAGTMITLAMFERCLWRLADIRSGRVKKPARKEGRVVGLVGAEDRSRRPGGG